MQWLGEHPDFMSNPVYLGSDSYAGIYTPILAQDIINGKIHIEHRHLIHLASYKSSPTYSNPVLCY